MIKLFSNPSPAVSTRGVHLDLKGMPPLFPRLKELVQLFAKLRFNVLLVEWEDTFPWTCEPRLRGNFHYSEEQVIEFAALCDSLGIEFVPLVQSLGHAENVLRLEGYEDLREVPQRTDVFHPLHPRSPQIVKEMVEDVLRVLPNTKRFHLGGDEVYTLGEHPESQRFAEQHGREALYLQQLQPTLELLQQHAIRPLLWHDEFVHWNEEALKAIAPQVDLMVWGYTGDPRDSTTYHHRLPHAEKLQACGFPLWAVSAYKGADGPCSNFPNIPKRTANTAAWVDMQSEFPWLGIICSAWSRYASGRTQVEPLETSLDSLVSNAATLYNGQAPSEQEVEDCLKELQEWERFHSNHALLREFDIAQKNAWWQVQQLEEQQVNLTLEPTRAHSGVEGMILVHFQRNVEKMRDLGLKLEEAFQDLTPDWCNRNYHLCRQRPIEIAYQRLSVAFPPPEVLTSTVS